MNSKKSIFITLISMSLFTANVSHAAFPVKKDIEATEVVTTAPAETMPVATTAAAQELTQKAVSMTAHQKHSFFSKIATKLMSPKKSASVPKVLYIVLAIIGWGWLAMGINDNFSDFDWVLSLILYFLFYLPGLIYTLVKMKKYY